jgi:hypothetical protein
LIAGRPGERDDGSRAALRLRGRLRRQPAIKLSLRQWSRFALADRHELLITPCASPSEIDAYESMVVDLITASSREEPKRLPELPIPLWETVDATPAAVIDFARSLGVAAPWLRDWRELSELQRFTLIKLTRDNHDNVNFLPAMREFGLTDGK